MALPIATRSRRLAPSGIRAINDLAASRDNAIHLEMGEPDYPTPAHIADAATAAARDGWTKYAPTAGFQSLRDAIVAKLEQVNGRVAASDQVIITAGATEGLFATFLALLDSGSEVLYPDPGWPNGRMMIELAGGHVVGYPLTRDQGFAPDVAAMARQISSKTRAIVVNSPSNPLGTVIPEPAIKELLRLASKNDLWLISDECYEAILFDEVSVSPAALDADGRVISVHSFSKTYSMTGWRVGYIVAPADLATTITKMQQAVVGCVNSPAQMAALAALKGPQEIVQDMCSGYRQRRDLALGELGRGPAVAEPPRGAFYVWIDITASGTNSLDFAKGLLNTSAVAVVPGSAFGRFGEGFVRMSLAAAPSLVVEGARRLSSFCLNPL